MKVIIQPSVVLCGACGAIMLMKRQVTPTPSTQMIVYCAMLLCPERRKHYLLDMEARELQPAPTFEEACDAPARGVKQA
jgi:hypothetical protein